MTNGLPIPIYILKQGETVPQETCYLVTRDGVFLHKLNGLVEALVKVEGICFLASVKSKAILHLPKIPALTMARALVFFRKIHEQLNSEANLLLYYRTDGHKRYRFVCPFQEVSAASVEYGAEERSAGYQLVGTAHSHNRLPAFHSGVDKTDESCFDGLHITVGSLDKFPQFSVSCSVVVNNQRFKLEPEETIAGIAKTKNKGIPVPARTKGWIADIAQSVDEGLTLLLDPGSVGYGLTCAGQIWTPAELHELTLPKNKELDSVTFPNQWLGRVRKKTFLPRKGDSGYEFQDSRFGGDWLRPLENPAAVSGFPIEKSPDCPD